MRNCKSWLLNWLKLQQTGGVEPSIDLSEYFRETIVYSSNANTSGAYGFVKKLPDNLQIVDNSLRYAFYLMRGLVEMPNLDTSAVTDMRNAFQGCTSITEVKNWDFSKVTTCSNMFSECLELVYVPVLNLISVNSMTSMFMYCTKLSDESLDNILQICINVPATYSATKTLANVGVRTQDYPRAKIIELPHYQDFVSAGWSIE